MSTDDRSPVPLPPPERGEWLPFAAARFAGWAVVLALVGLLLIASSSAADQPADPDGDRPSAVSFSLQMQGRLSYAVQQFSETVNDAGEVPAADLTALRLEAAKAIDGLAVDLLDRALTAPADRTGSLVDLLAEHRRQHPDLAPVVDGLLLLDDGGVVLGPAEPAVEQARRRLGWYADLVAAGACGAGPVDSDFQQAAQRFGIVLMIGGTALTILLVGSMVVFCVVLWQVMHGRWRFALLPEADPRSVYLTTFAAYLTCFIIYAAGAQWLGAPMPAALWPFLLCALPLIGWLQFNGETGSEMRRRLGLHAGRGVLREIGAGLLGYLAGIPVILSGFVLSIALAQMLQAEPVTHQPMEELLRGDTSWLLLLLTVSVFAPLVEEVMFRGALYHHLRGHRGWLTAGLLSGVLFAAIHPQGALGIPALCAIAMVLSWIREWRGSLIGCIAAHAVHNGIITGCALLLMRG